MSEEKLIMDFLGRPVLDGDVRGTHLGKVLTYLKITNTENLDITLSKLALVLGMNPRYIRENYLKGLMYFDIIKLYQKGNSNYWRWIGVSAFNGHSELKNLIAPIPPPIIIKEELLKEEKIIKTPPKEKKKNLCKNCKKEIPETSIYCNEKCVREYYAKKEKK